MTTIGHNLVRLDERQLADFEARRSAFLDAAKEWLDLGEIDDEARAARLNDYITGTRRLFAEIDAARKAAKEPHLEAGRVIDARYNGLGAPLALAIDKAKSLLTRFATAKAERERKAREAAQARARAEREQAEADARAAAARNDMLAEAEAEARAEQARKEAAQIARARPAGQVRSASGEGRTAGLRTYYIPELTSWRQAVMALHENHGDEIDRVLLRIAAERKRSDPGAEIPGVRFREEQRIA